MGSFNYFWYTIHIGLNRPFPSSLVPRFQNESECEKPFLWKWLWFAWKWNCRRNSFSYEWFALDLVFKQRHKKTRKWPIGTWIQVCVTYKLHFIWLILPDLMTCSSILTLQFVNCVKFDFGKSYLSSDTQTNTVISNRFALGLSRSCSATFEQLFGFGATFSPSSNFSDFEHFFPFWITFSPF